MEKCEEVSRVLRPLSLKLEKYRRQTPLKNRLRLCMLKINFNSTDLTPVSDLFMLVQHNGHYHNIILLNTSQTPESFLEFEPLLPGRNFRVSKQALEYLVFIFPTMFSVSYGTSKPKIKFVSVSSIKNSATNWTVLSPIRYSTRQKKAVRRKSLRSNIKMSEVRYFPFSL